MTLHTLDRILTGWTRHRRGHYVTYHLHRDGRSWCVVYGVGGEMTGKVRISSAAFTTAWRSVDADGFATLLRTAQAPRTGAASWT